MKTNKELLKANWRRVSVALALSACLVNFTSCDKYDLDETDPEGWGASIYSYLEEQGNYTNTINLINDLGYKEVLAKTGSKTMFVADDAAFERFYANNSWGVKNYGQLSSAQKKMLLLGAMVNNSYQVNNLSSIEGPVEGQCMRRLSSQSIFDTVSVVNVNDLPNINPDDWRNNSSWAKFAKGETQRSSVVLMRDNTIPPMIHFIEAQMKNNKITNDDYNFLYNYTTDRKAGEASVNGVQILQQNIKCSNGFIHKMAEVVMPLQNMAEIIASNSEASTYNKLLERFCVPYYVGESLTEQYNYQFNTNVDSVFAKRFFSQKSQNGLAFQVDDDNVVAKSLLKYDPEWNTYYQGIAMSNSSTQSANSLLEKNMGVMMVPSNAAMDEYWNNGAGKVLRKQYGTWDNVPNDVIVELINNNMLESFIESVPSKFSGILNDANDPMGVSKEAIDKVWLGCNGAVYLTNKVYSPTSFVSVLYPAIVNQNLKIMKWAVEKCQYNYYLNSLNSYYSFFVPNNDALLTYIDPVSYGKTTTQIYKFHYDPTLTNPVWASIYEYDPIFEEVLDSIGEDRDENSLKSRLKDVLDNHIVIGNVEDGNTYYRTKGGQEIKVTVKGENSLEVEGSYQINEKGKPLTVVPSNVYDQTKDGNGKCYILNEAPIMTTRKTAYDIISEHPEFSEFKELLEGSSLLETIHDEKYACTGKNISLFNTFHYTIYIPTNEAIRAYIGAGKLPTWDDVDAIDERTDIPDDAKATEKQKLTEQIENFLKLHIQDYALYIGAKPETEDGYETGMLNDKGKFERLYVTLTKDDIKIRTSNKADDQKYYKVTKKPGLYNLMAREYIVDGKDTKTATNIYTSSTAVIHQIDGVITK